MALSRSSGRSLILELGATWCGPCKVFAAKVLPRPEVQAALQGTVFVQYDIDVGPGLKAQQRFLSAGNGATYPVPTFVALDGEGQVKHRLVGLGDPDDPDRFLAFISESRARLMGDDLLQSTLSHKPHDGMLHAERGRRLAMRGDIPQALSEYDRALAAKAGLFAESRAEVHAEALRLRRLEAMRRQTIRDSAQLVRAHPRASNLLTHLALATIGSGLSGHEIGALYKTVLATDRRGILYRAVYLALAAGARAQARNGATKLVALSPRDPLARDALAETHLALGQTADALREEDEAIALAEESAKPLHREHRARLAAGKPESSLVVAERDRVAQRWAALFRPEGAPANAAPPSPEQKAQNDFRIAIAEAARKAAQTCQLQVGELQEVYFRLALAAQEGPPRKVEVLEPAAARPLKDCVVKALMSSELPRAPATFRGRYVGNISFASDGRAPGGLAAPTARMRVPSL